MKKGFSIVFKSGKNKSVCFNSASVILTMFLILKITKQIVQNCFVFIFKIITKIVKFRLVKYYIHLKIEINRIKFDFLEQVDEIIIQLKKNCIFLKKFSICSRFSDTFYMQNATLNIIFQHLRLFSEHEYNKTFFNSKQVTFVKLLNSQLNDQELLKQNIFYYLICKYISNKNQKKYKNNHRFQLNAFLMEKFYLNILQKFFQKVVDFWKIEIKIDKIQELKYFARQKQVYEYEVDNYLIKTQFLQQYKSNNFQQDIQNNYIHKCVLMNFQNKDFFLNHYFHYVKMMICLQKKHYRLLLQQKSSEFCSDNQLNFGKFFQSESFE
eukprot:TRINITY_DN468_c2_g2_i2.p1 TRINITY_DN468_c2_g2~~TRINITY_DN468_c2_g2_i2.p1  ORF type:complete len:324 (+),score=-5.94 TRINITY_DN468_c2_g2_i2:145-1116(+)